MRLVPAKTRGVITGLLVAIQRVIAIAAIQAGGLVLDAHMRQAFPGAFLVYSTTGWVLTLAVLASLVRLAGGAVALFIPRGDRDIEAASEAELPLTAAGTRLLTVCPATLKCVLHGGGVVDGA